MSNEKELEGVEVVLTEEQTTELEIAQAEIEQADAIKKKYNIKKVFQLEVQDEDGDGEWAKAYVRKPNLKEFSAFAKISQDDNIKALKVLLVNIFLEGDKRIIEDDDFFLSAMPQLNEIVSVQASRIKKF